MKLIYLVLPLLLILSACGNSKAIDSPKEETLEAKTSLEENYTLNVEIIDNRMPSSTQREFMYAIVLLKSKSGKLEDNWKISSFEINGISFTQYDEIEPKGKDQLLYKNNVREIPKDIEQPFSTIVKLESDKGKVLKFQFSDLSIEVVH